MPELDGTFTSQRLQRRISELEAGEEIAKRDICAVLDETQQQELESKLAAMQALKKQSRARTDAEKKAVGWKSIREVRIEVLKRALAQAESNGLDSWKVKQQAAEVRRAQIYMQAFDEARKAEKSTRAAHTWANNALTRAGLNRMDGRIVGDATARDKAVRGLEEKIQQRARSEMTPDELEQIELLELHMKEVAARRKTRKDQTD